MKKIITTMILMVSIISSGYEINTQKTEELIKTWENFESQAYEDGGRWSIGYGTVSYPGEHITKKEAHNRMWRYINKNVIPFLKNMENNSPLEFTPAQRSSLISLIYNVGQGQFRNSRCYQHFLNGRWKKAVPEWLDFNRIDGEFSQGLYNRRKAEVGVFIRK